MEREQTIYDEAAHEAVELANRLADEDREAHLWEIADGLLAGAVHYWLYSRQPCGDPRCEDCARFASAAQRITEIKRIIDECSVESDYYHSPHDTNVGRA